MKWDVVFTRQAAKQVQKISKRVLLVLQVLVGDLSLKGPAPGNAWPNYGKLHGWGKVDQRHCHLIKGNPTYVCCWKVHKTEKIIEVYYVDTHEKAPY